MDALKGSADHVSLADVFHVYRMLSETEGETLCGASPIYSVGMYEGWRLRNDQRVCRECIGRFWQLQAGAAVR